MAGSFVVPAGVAHAAGATDPHLREVRTVLDGIKNRMPGLSHDLTARRNVWGDEVKRGSGAGQGAAGSAYNFISPVYTSSISRDPVLKEMARLRVPLSMPQRSLTIDGVKHRLTPEQYSYYVQLSGKPAKAFFSGYIGSDEWQNMTEEERRDTAKERLKEFRAGARGQLKQMFPDLGAPPPPAGFALAE
jgi:hypothetical protein